MGDASDQERKQTVPGYIRIKHGTDWLNKLKSKSGSVRNKAAIAIKDSKLRGGKSALLEAALEKKNIGNTGTLVYALEAFNCQDLFSILFDLAIFGNYEVKCMALGVLEDQDFLPTPLEIKMAEYKLVSLTGEEFDFEEKESLIYSLKRVVAKTKRAVNLKLVAKSRTKRSRK